MEYVQLLGAEQVERASHRMSTASVDMHNAAERIAGALENFMREFTAQVDRIVEASEVVSKAQYKDWDSGVWTTPPKGEG